MNKILCHIDLILTLVCILVTIIAVVALGPEGYVEHVMKGFNQIKAMFQI
jgi:hypothetical protein